MDLTKVQRRVLDVVVSRGTESPGVWRAVDTCCDDATNTAQRVTGVRAAAQALADLKRLGLVQEAGTSQSNSGKRVTTYIPTEAGRREIAERGVEGP